MALKVPTGIWDKICVSIVQNPSDVFGHGHEQHLEAMRTLSTLRLVNRKLNASAKEELFRLVAKKFSRRSIHSFQAFFQESFVCQDNAELVQTIRLTAPISRFTQEESMFLASIPMSSGLQAELRNLRRLELDHPLPADLRADFSWSGRAAWLIPLLSNLGVPKLKEMSIHLPNIESFEGIL